MVYNKNTAYSDKCCTEIFVCMITYKCFFSFQTSEDLYNYLNVAPLLPSIISLTYAWNICKYLTIPCLRSEHFSWENRE